MEKTFLAQDLWPALEFSAKAHRYQKRKDKGGTAYINHPIAVAGYLMEAGVSSLEAILAALLHDTKEDCGVTEEDLEKVFGSEVAAIVEECSDDKKLPKEERKRLQIVHAEHLSVEACMVKVGDKISNLSDLIHFPPDWKENRLADYVRWCKNVVDEVGKNMRQNHSDSPEFNAFLKLQALFVQTYVAANTLYPIEVISG